MRVTARNHRGSTLVEFSLVALLFVGLSGAIFDYGLYFHRAALLSHATAEASRQAVVDFSAPDCAAFHAQACGRAHASFQRYGVGAAVSTSIDNPGGDGTCSLARNLDDQPA